MADASREKRLTAAFVSLADTLVAGYDTVDLLQTLVDTCADVLDASAVGLLLADETGELAVVASTSERSRLVEMLQLDSGEGPCVETFHTGRPISVPDIAADDRWPTFRALALELDLRAMLSVPMRLRESVIGTLNLFRSQLGALDEEDTTTAQALADIATIGILHERAIRESSLAQEQLQHALNSRVVIEQAKGVIAQVREIDMDAAFTVLRDHSRNTRTPLREVAELVIRRKLEL